MKTTPADAVAATSVPAVLVVDGDPVVDSVPQVAGADHKEDEEARLQHNTAQLQRDAAQLQYDTARLQ